MFMRYLGGGIGHVLNEMQPNEEESEMDVNEDVDEGDVDEEDSAGPQDLVERLLQLANLRMADERDEAQRAVAPEDPDTEVSDDEGDMDNASAVGENEGEDNLGPEDGEDEGYVDTGYGAP
jgi:hypothetical protein